jgi:hypothetical protein
MPAQTLLPVPSFAKIEPAQLPLPSQVVAVAARDSFTHPLVIQSLAAHAARGERLGVLIGHNRFDVYALSRLAIEHGLDPRPMLERIELSRAFTCHQLHRRILTLGTPHTERWSALYVLGLLDTFYDEDVKQYEARRLLSECLVKLKEIAAGGLPVLITVSAPQEPGREHFLEMVAGQADMYWAPVEEAPRLTGPRQLALQMG